MLKSRIENHVTFGRSLITTEKVSKGELVVEEFPLAFGPKQNSHIVCLNCLRDLQLADNGILLDRCKICTWPLCNECASYESGPHESECKVFASAQVHFAGDVDNNGVCMQLDCITPLRVLLVKETNPTRWESEVMAMEHHTQARTANVDVWHADRVNIALYLRGPCKLADILSEELIMRVVGILEVNAFEARSVQGYPLRCLYPITGILAHNCVPNTTRSIYPSENYKIRLRVMRQLEPGAQLNHSYTYTTDGTLQRQSHLKAGKYFTCLCLRCLDPTELGTGFTSLRCNKCQAGWLTSKNPLDANADWLCSDCKFETAGNRIQQAVIAMQVEVSAVHAIAIGSKRLRQTEQLVRKFRSVLHPSHFLQTTLNQDLIEMYGRVQGYELAQLPEALLKRKVKLCRRVLRLLDLFEPGLSRARAFCLYELHLPLIQLAKRAFVMGICNKETFHLRLNEVSKILKECVDILKHEDFASQEGSLCKLARLALAELH